MRRAAALVLCLAGCARPAPAPEASAAPGSAVTAAASPPPSAAPPPVISLAPAPTAPPPPACPSDMVHVAGRLCVDRFEAQLVDAATGVTLSPYHPPDRRLATMIQDLWEKERFTMGSPSAQAMLLPPLPSFERARAFEPRAVSRKAVVPSGYVNGKQAAAACANAGKRLCKLEEWRLACRGEADRQYPYGEKYEQGVCNVFREGHPAGALHDDMTIGHADPRLNLVKIDGKPLLRRTGDTPRCASRWGDDAVWDMVGNLDEWIDDPKGTFVGGFFSRSTREGCGATIKAHAIDYFDYSTGVRCCRDPQ